MWLSTQTFVHNSPNPKYRCFFYFLVDRYLLNEKSVGSSLNSFVESFAEDLDHYGMITKPNASGLRSVEKELKDKFSEHKGALSKLEDSRPALLMLDRPFKDFKPEEHKWMVFSFKDHLEEKGVGGLYKYCDLLKKLLLNYKNPKLISLITLAKSVIS